MKGKKLTRLVTTYERAFLRAFAVFATGAAALVFAPELLAAAPVNDNFAAAQTLSGSALDLPSTNKDGTKKW